MATKEVRKRALFSGKDREKFFREVDERIGFAKKQTLNKDKRIKSDLVKKLEVVKIVYLLQTYGMRVNEAVSLSLSSLKSILSNDSFEYVVSKSKSEIKIRTIRFEDYKEYESETKLLKDLVEKFVLNYKGGLFAEKDKVENYEQKVTVSVVKKRVESFKRRLVRDMVEEKEINKRVKRFKALDKNKVGYIYAITPKYIIDFTRLFNTILKSVFGTFVKDGDKIKIDKATGKKILKSDSELNNTKKTNKFTTHSLRAGFVVSQFQEGKDLVEIQKDIKHSDLNQTNAYLVEAKRKKRVETKEGGESGLTKEQLTKIAKMIEAGII